MEFSYKDGTDFVFTNPENYETVTLAAELVGNDKNYLVENATVTVEFVEDKAVSIELPSSSHGFDVAVFPLRLKGASAAPARVVAFLYD